MAKSFETSTHWTIDNRIDLTAVAEKANLHRGTIQDALQSFGIVSRDADAFAAFICCESAKVRDYLPEDCVSDEQYERLNTFATNDWKETRTFVS